MDLPPEKITSLQNPRIKHLVKLRDRRPRETTGWSWPQQQYQAQVRERARDILDKRYARGEIARDQYEAMKRDIGAP